jgi:hypothetical protein
VGQFIGLLGCGFGVPIGVAGLWFAVHSTNPDHFGLAFAFIGLFMMAGPSGLLLLGCSYKLRGIRKVPRQPSAAPTSQNNEPES